MYEYAQLTGSELIRVLREHGLTFEQACTFYYIVAITGFATKALADRVISGYLCQQPDSYLLKVNLMQT